MSNSKTFTVIAFYEDNWQTFIGTYQARDADHAMEQAWYSTEDELLVVAVAAGTPELHDWEYVQSKSDNSEPLRDA